MCLPAGPRGKKDPSRCKHVGRIYPQPDVKGQKYEYLQGGGGRGGGRGTRACRSLVKVQWPRGNRSHSREFRMNVSEILHLTSLVTKMGINSSELDTLPPPSPSDNRRVPVCLRVSLAPRPAIHHSADANPAEKVRQLPGNISPAHSPPPAPARPPSGPRPCTSS